MYMSSPIQNRSHIDKATIQAHRAIVPALPAAHTLSGCNTVPSYFGIGKGTVLRVLKAAPNSLSQLGCPDASLSEVVDEATKFIGNCYNKGLKENTMSDNRYKVWTTKFGKTITSTPKFETLPPSTEAFTENVKRAHLETCIWKCAVLQDPAEMDPLQFGYIKHKPSRSVIPTTVPEGVPLAPDIIMTLIKCGCEGSPPCKNLNCSCIRHKLPCTVFCKFCAGTDCSNELTKSVATDEV